MKIEPVYLNGVRVFPFDSAEQLQDYVDEHKGILVAINAEKILMAGGAMSDIINRNIGYSDGIGAVKAMHQKGYKKVSKIAGCELWLKMIERYQTQKTFYLVGGKQEVIEQTVEKLREEYPPVKIVGFRNGYINDDQERKELIEDIVEKQPDVVFVAMGSPKQEMLMGEMQLRHQAIYQGLGGSFDVYTGHVLRAPKWWVDHNVEFLYRLIKQPKRIGRQLHLFKFAWWLIIGKFK